MGFAQRLRAAVVAALCALALASCTSGDDAPAASRDAPVEVEVGEEFSWNDFTVEQGWTITAVERSVDMQEVETPEITGTIVNGSSEERAALFQIVFVREGDPIATVNCSSPTMIEDQSMQFLCPGLNTTVPEDYDTVVVQKYERDTGSGDGSDGA